MKKLALTLPLIAVLSAPAFAEEAQDVNYGDPTASYTGLGMSRGADATQFNGIYGMGSHIFTADVTVADKKDDLTGQVSARGRYFHVTEGLGYSLDIIGNKAMTGAIAGAMYKFQVTPNIMLFPMAGIGYAATEFTYEDTKVSESSMMNQVGAYAMYAFDNGNWVYANPRTTYINEAKTRFNEVTLGGGMMIAPQASLGLKVEHVLNDTALKMDKKDATSVWVNANYYF
ncbi:porin family protein [Vibrio sp. SCSIO 43136]|uniref:porin family protein n=1 Tax=Vibrio sp. SCSIO 43136 TaxID=2819101 RepID=UPI002074CBF4|nr:porin family protein [Vibrio sp. SCSIO 43136]USD67854.1 hypothetical protein J4N39_16855 [Vibrio sp. SCSIO 43136]